MIQYKELNQPLQPMHINLNTVQYGRLSRPFENKDNILRVEVVSDLAYKLCYCVKIAVNQIPTESGHLVQ